MCIRVRQTAYKHYEQILIDQAKVSMNDYRGYFKLTVIKLRPMVWMSVYTARHKLTKI